VSCVIVPNWLRHFIDGQLDAALSQCPEAVGERDQLFKQAVAYYDQHGTLPPFTIQKENKSCEQIENPS
jgi:hypothetical protein